MIGIYFDYPKTVPVIKVFPNPSDGERINITMTGIVENIELFVYDMYGEEIFSRSVNQENGAILTVIEPAIELTPGIYFIIGKGATNVYREKLIVR